MTDKIVIPKTVTKEMFICVGIGKWTFNEISITAFDHSENCSEGWEYVFLKKQTMTVDLSGIEIDDNGVKKEMVKKLEEKKKELKADLYMKIKEIQDKIDNLLAIEYQPEPTPVPEAESHAEKFIKFGDKRYPSKNTIGG